MDSNFTQEKPNYVWVSDISFVKVQKRFVYICVIIDIFSRKVISFHLSEKIDADLTLKTFDEAFEMRGRHSIRIKGYNILLLFLWNI